jgi:crossover junction endodeoxyribonuclease RusA
MQRIELKLPFPPSVNRLWRVGKGGMFKSKEYQTWLMQAGWVIAIQAKGQKISGKYNLTINAVRPDKRKRDLDNLIKAVSDALETNDIIDGDHLCEHLEMSWVIGDFECLVIIEGVEDGQKKQL